MALYTVLDDQAIDEILRSYGLKLRGDYKVLSGGSENTNYKVETDKGSAVLTICEQKSVEAANELASLLVYLDQHDFATSKLIKTTAGDLTISHKGKPVMLKAFIEGIVIKDLPEALLINLGRDLARLHQIPPPDYVPTEISYGIEHFHKVAIYAADSPFHHWIEDMEDFITEYITDDLPKALIHSDIFYNNIIVSADQLEAQIMDFEEATYYYRIFDIGMMLIGVCSEAGKLRLDQAHSLLKGYQQEIDLLPAEKAALQAFTVYGAAATGYWRHQNFNYVKPDPAMAEHHLAMKNLADSVRSIPEAEFIKILT